MMPTEKALQQFKKSEKDVIGGLCRCVFHNHASDKMCIVCFDCNCELSAY